MLSARSRSRLWSILPGMVLAASLTAWRYDAKPMWRDEYFTYGTVNRTWSGMMNILEGPDVGLVGYYTVMHLWMLVGDSTAWMRAPGAIATVLLAAVVTLMGRRLGGTVVGVASGLIVAVLPAVTDHAQEARAYPLVLLATAVAGLFAFRVAAAPTRAARVGLAASALVAGLMHPLPGLPAVAGILLGLLLFPGAERRRNVVLTGLPVALVGGAVVVLAYARQGDVDPGPQDAVSGLLAFVLNVAPTRILAAAFAIPAFLGLLRLVRVRPALAILLGWCVLPIVVIAGLGLSGSYFQHRYIATIVPAVAALMGVGLVWVGELMSMIPRMGATKWLYPALGVAVVAAALAPGLVEDRRAEYFFDDPAAVTSWLEGEYQAGDAVVFSGGIGRGMVGYYSSGAVELDDVLLVESPLSSDTLAGVLLPEDQWPAVLADRPRVWLVGTLTRGEWLDADVSGAVQADRDLDAEFARGGFAAELWTR